MGLVMIFYLLSGIILLFAVRAAKAHDPVR